MTAITKQELQSMGYRVVDGRAQRTVTEPGDADTTWQQMETKCRQVFEKAGCTVYSTSERRRVKRSAGVPDLIVFGPPGAPFHLYFEVKSGRGKLSEAQQKFALQCQRTGTEYQSGGDYIARQMLKLMLGKYGTGNR